MPTAQETQGSGPRLLRLLQAIASGEREFALKDAAARVRLPPSTVHRLLAFLVKADMVERTGRRQYRIGSELFRVAALVGQKLDTQQAARPPAAVAVSLRACISSTLPTRTTPRGRCVRGS
jgi:DNA-binding IclR family transcriptional regulator